MTNEVKFLQGQFENLSGKTLDVNTIYASNDQSVMGLAGKLYYGKPTIKYENDTIKLYGVDGVEGTKLGEVNLTLDSFLEKSAYYETLDAAKAGLTSTTVTEQMIVDGYNAAFPAGYSGNTAAIYLVMHEEHSGAGGDAHSVIVLPVGKIIGDAQTEIDKIEEGAGLKSDGSYSAKTDANYISNATSLVDADNKLDAQVKANAGAIVKNTITAASVNDVTATITTADAGTSIAVTIDGDDVKVGDYTPVTYADPFSGKTGVATVATGDTLDQAINKVEGSVKVLVNEVIANEQTASAAIKAVGAAAGVVDESGNIGYVANTSDTYISGATSLKDADDKLDEAIKNLASKVAANELTSKTIAITTASGKTNIEVQVIDDANDAVHIATGDSGVTVSLTIDSTEDDAVSLSKSAAGLKATLKVNNTAVSDTNGGIELTNTTDGLSAKLYWGTF